jgi:hypothetical protein
MTDQPSGSGIKYVLHQRSFYVALLLWILLSIAGAILARGIPALSHAAYRSSVTLVIILLMIGVAALVTHKRPVLDLGQRAPERSTALRETLLLWLYGASIMIIGRILGQHLFGEGIALHLNGSLVGATRIQSPTEVYTWAIWNFTLFALVPYLVFRLRGYSNFQLNLKSANLKNDTLVILVVLAMSCALDLTGPNIFQLTLHQQLVGGPLSFLLHLFGTDLPIMIFIYAILVPRYAKIFSPMTAFLLGAVSYPTIHLFESGTHYNSPLAAVLSATFIYLGFFPAGLMKSFLTFRTGNAWVHLWAFHAISPHVTVDTRLVVHDFHIQ